MEGFNLLRKWMSKHHPNLDLFGLVMDDVVKELMSNCHFEAMVENVTEEAINVAEVMEEAAITTFVDHVPNEQ